MDEGVKVWRTFYLLDFFSVSLYAYMYMQCAHVCMFICAWMCTCGHTYLHTEVRGEYYMSFFSAALIFVVKTASLAGLGEAGWRNACRGGNLLFAQHGSFFLPLSLPSSDSTSSTTSARNFQISWLATSPLAALMARCPHYPRPCHSELCICVVI